MNDWISVHDGPVPEKELLAFGQGKEMLIGYIIKDGDHSYFCETYSERLDHVTHWMPLPEPPKP